MSETLPVIDMPVNIDMDVDKGKMLLEILQNAAKFNHGFSFGGGTGGAPVPAVPARGVPGGVFNPGAIPGAGNGRGIASRAGNAMLNTVIAPFILLGKTTDLTTKSVKIFGSALKKTTGALQGIFTSVIKWSLGLTAIAGGGVFGYSRLARGVSNDFNASRGLGVSTGFNKAFNTVWGNKLDGAGEFLNAVSMAKGDPGSEGAKTLLGLGINPNGDEQANTMAALRSAWAYARQHKDSSSGKRQFDVLYGGLKLGGTGFNQLGRMDEEEFNKNADMLAKQTKNNEISERTQRSYQDIMIQLEGNMNSLGTTFVKMLQELNPKILSFSDAITQNLNKFMTGNGKDLFTRIGEGMKWFSGYIASEGFKNDITFFTQSVGKMAQSIKYWLGVLGFTDTPDVQGETTKENGEHTVRQAFREYVTGKYNTPEAFLSGTGKFLGTVFDEKLLSPMRNRAVGHARKNQSSTADWLNDAWNFLTAPPPMLQSDDRHYRRMLMHKIGKMNDAAGFPEGLMSTVARLESQFNPKADNGIARGLWQLTRETSEGYNLDWNDAFDPEKSSNVARQYLTDNLRRYDGDIAKTLAQYNGGNKAVQGNKLNLKLETVNYLLKALESIPDMAAQHPELKNQLTSARGKMSNRDSRVSIDLSIHNTPGADYNLQVTSSLATASAMRFNGIPK
ncbi:transglycosylase SLT domain-containing protein [Enterobacter ludwigii]